MHLVVQEMVDARAAGVVFTADPTSARRDLAVVDAIAGLGEALVDGSTSSDHYEIDRDGRITDRQAAESPAITDAEVTAIAAGARQAEARWGYPLDLEWAIDGVARSDGCRPGRSRRCPVTWARWTRSSTPWTTSTPAATSAR